MESDANKFFDVRVPTTIVEELRVGIIGVGLKGGDPRYLEGGAESFFGHLQALESIVEEGVFGESFEVKLAAFGDVDPGVLERVGRRHPGAHLSTECFDLLDDGLVDAVWIATPTAFHKEYALRAFRRGIHAFVEKPVAFTLDDVDELVRERDRAGVVCQVGLAGRHLPLVPYLAALYRRKRGAWGRLMNVVFRDEQEKPYLDKPLHPSTWRKDASLARAGVLFEHSCHDLDALSFLFGDVVEVYGKVNYYAGHEGIEDSVSGVLTLANGATVTVSAVWTDVEHDERLVEAYFENAFIKLRYGVDGLDFQLVERGRERRPAKLDAMVVMAEFLTWMGFPSLRPTPADPTRFADVAFLDAIARGKPASPSLEDARRVQRVVEAVYESSRNGCPVRP
ncbi:MAG: hypothetical protein Kow0069_12810 [Promethearchaeota archaeon]